MDPTQYSRAEGIHMFAVVVRESGDRDAIAGSVDQLKAGAIPRTRQAPGIVSALWMTDGSGGTLNVLVFESEDAARGASERIRNAPRPGFMKLESVRVFDVLAQF
jgi:hypothetical protein